MTRWRSHGKPRSLSSPSAENSPSPISSGLPAKQSAKKHRLSLPQSALPHLFHDHHPPWNTARNGVVVYSLLLFASTPCAFIYMWRIAFSEFWLGLETATWWSGKERKMLSVLGWILFDCGVG